VNDEIVFCHFPATGNVGNIVFKDIPCLLTLTNNPKTKYTIDAISLNGGKNWIGINQIKANSVIENLLRTNQLIKIIDTTNSEIKRERKVGNSRLDFVINDIYIEVKTPLIILPLKDGYVSDKIQFTKKITSVSTDRFFKHLDELSHNIKRSILLLLYMFEAKPFCPPKNNNGNGEKIKEKVLNSIQNGVEVWQVNCKFTPRAIELVDYYRCEKYLCN
jgi:sugar fermentation stimulation protein A